MSMASFETIDELWVDAANMILEQGHASDSRKGGRDSQTYEVIGTAHTLRNIEFNFLLNPRRKLPPMYACAEMLWYLSNQSHVQMIQAYAPQYKLFANEGVAFGAYGARWMYDHAFMSATTDIVTKTHDPRLGFRTQIECVIKLLKEKPDTRQAIIIHWNGGDLRWALEGSKNDLPCTICLQFLVRQGELHCSCAMRSNDIWLGMPNDIFCFTTLQRFIADLCGYEYGHYHHHVIGSLHVYQKDIQKLRESTFEMAIKNTPKIGHGYKNRIQEDLKSQVGAALHTEACCREGRIFSLKGENPIRIDALWDLVWVACSQWNKVAVDRISSPALLYARHNHVAD